MKTKQSLVLLLAIMGLMIHCKRHKSENKTKHVREKINANAKSKASEALDFCRANNMNTDFCILIDMSVHSGLKRMMLWNFNKEKVEASFLVSHGCGDAFL
ncbi:hypothetical protein ACSVH5_02365 [Flavobacterium sp. RSSA_27]|uniref:hypothetical protein n=1 Tax=Flavobacterium sp. RSSA_27 TaxID=3447667 RepID=UPI003F31C390